MARLPFEARFPEESLYAFPLALPIPHQLQATLPDLAQLLDRSDEPHGKQWCEAPVALYIHVPYCLTLCNFCGFIKSPLGDRTRLDAFVRDVITELRIVAEGVGDGTPLDAVYFGGGTPSVLTLLQVAQIIAAIRSYFTVRSSCELSFEGEALTLGDATYLDGLSALGFRRLSFGVQTLDEGARKVLNLRPSIQHLNDVCQKAQRVFPEVNVDFIYGWPGQRQDDLERDLSKLLNSMQPSSIEVFQFEPLDASPDLIRRLAAAGAKVPNTGELQEMQRHVRSTLRSRSFGEPSYTKYTKAEVHHQGKYDQCYYGWGNGQVLGVGRGSQSFFKGLMWGSGMSEQKYQESLAQLKLPISALAAYKWDERELVTWPRRMCVDSVIVANNTEAQEKIARLAEADLLTETGSRLMLTESGVDWIPSILNYLMPAAHTPPVLEMTQERSLARRPMPISIVAK